MKKLLTLTLILIFLPISFAALADNLVHLWKFDDATTSGATSYDSINASWHGTITNAITGESGYWGESYKFDGATVSNTKVTVGNDTLFEGYTTFTISAWVKVEDQSDCADGGGDCSLIGNRNGGDYAAVNALTHLGSQGGLRLTTNTGDCYEPTPGSNPPEGQWYLMTITYNSSNIELWLNTTKVKSCSGSYGAISDRGTDYRIGTEGGEREHDGWLDEVAIWNRVLTDAEIATLHVTELGAGNSAPVIGTTTPVTGTHDNKNLSVFTTVTDGDDDPLVCSLWLNGTLEATNDTVSSGVAFTLNATSMVSDGVYTWDFNCTDGTSSDTIQRDFYLDTENPTINFNYPLNDNSTETNLYLISDVNITVQHPYLDGINFTVICEDGSQIYNNFTEDINLSYLTISDYLDLTSCGTGNHSFTVGAFSSLSESPKIDNQLIVDKDNEEVTNFILPDGSIITREFVIRDSLGQKVNSQTYELLEDSTFIDDGKHLKTTWTAKDIPTGGSFELVMQGEPGKLKLKTDRGITRIIDSDYTYYWRFDDMEAMGYELLYDDKSITEGRIEIKIDLGTAEKIKGKWELDPIVGGLNRAEVGGILLKIVNREFFKLQTPTGNTFFQVYTSGDVYNTGSIRQTSSNGTWHSLRVTNDGYFGKVDDFITTETDPLSCHADWTNVTYDEEWNTLTEVEAVWGLTVATDAELAAQDSCAEITGCVENAIQNLTDVKTLKLNVTQNLTVGNCNIFWNGSSVCICNC